MDAAMVQPMQKADIPLSAIDFHCSTISDDVQQDAAILEQAQVCCYLRNQFRSAFTTRECIHMTAGDVNSTALFSRSIGFLL